MLKAKKADYSLHSRGMALPGRSLYPFLMLLKGRVWPSMDFVFSVTRNFSSYPLACDWFSVSLCPGRLSCVSSLCFPWPSCMCLVDMTVTSISGLLHCRWSFREANRFTHPHVPFLKQPTELEMPSLRVLSLLSAQSTGVFISGHSGTGRVLSGLFSWQLLVLTAALDTSSYVSIELLFAK